jgi:hypothetical protein
MIPGKITIEGLVKNPSAALRGNPAPLDNHPGLGIQGQIL